MKRSKLHNQFDMYIWNIIVKSYLILNAENVYLTDFIGFFFFYNFVSFSNVADVVLLLRE